MIGSHSQGARIPFCSKLQILQRPLKKFRTPNTQNCRFKVSHLFKIGSILLRMH